MKMYAKSALTNIDGMLVADSGDVVSVDHKIVDQANKLDTMLQEAKYLADQPKASPMPTLEGFKRKSVKDDLLEGAKFEADTELLDLEAKKTMMMMEEMDDVALTEKANGLLSQFAELLAFVAADRVFDYGVEVIPFDTPELGDVLELTKDDVINAVAYVSGLEKEEEEVKTKRITADQMDEEDIEALLKIIAKHDEEAAAMMEMTEIVKDILHNDDGGDTDSDSVED